MICRKKGTVVTITAMHDDACIVEQDYSYSYVEYDDMMPYDKTIVPNDDITNRIKTLKDACRWCEKNGFSNLVDDYKSVIYNVTGISKDTIAYLQLCIITCALNEGWKPTFELDEDRYEPDFGYDDVTAISTDGIFGNSSGKLAFKSKELAIYAGKQFKELYMALFAKSIQQS